MSIQKINRSALAISGISSHRAGRVICEKDIVAALAVIHEIDSFVEGVFLLVFLNSIDALIPSYVASH